MRITFERVIINSDATTLIYERNCSNRTNMTWEYRVISNGKVVKRFSTLKEWKTALDFETSQKGFKVCALEQIKG